MIPIRAALHAGYGFDVQGEGMMHFDFMPSRDRLSLNAHLKNGSIRLPHTYNFVHG